MKARRRKAQLFKNPLGLQEVKGRSLPRSAQSLRKQKKLTPIERLKAAFRRRKFVFTWKKFFIWVLACLAVLIIGVSAVFAYFIRQLPNPSAIAALPVAQSTQIEDRNGNIIYSFHGDQNRVVVTNDQISDNIKNATVAIEDDTFYTNDGLSLRGILRAIYGQITRNPAAGGGSTITQQYIKNTLLNDQHTFTRKIKEAILAIEIDQRYDKKTILTGYLNQIAYGGDNYGVEAASRAYFGKSAKDLTLSEAATLAAIPNAPTYYSPYGIHLSDLFDRKKLVLDRMKAVNFITQAQEDQALKDTPNLENPNFQPQGGLLAPHFVFYVRQYLIDTVIGGDPQLAEQKLDEGGYTVVTSLDLPTQELAQQVLTTTGNNVIKKWHGSNAALTAIDPKTGQILAMAGSIDYSNSQSGEVNYAATPRQLGSSFKVFEYSTALSPGHTYAPSSVFYDLQTNFGTDSTPYKPSDYNGSCEVCGPVTMRMAIQGSLNIPAVKVTDLVGVAETIATAKKMGITTLTGDPNSYGDSLALGTGPVELVEMTNAYTAFDNAGQVHPLTPVLQIYQNNKLVRDFTKTEATQAIDPAVAGEMTSILSDNASRTYVFGANSPLVLPGRPSAAKTGTTESNKNTSTIGFTPTLAVGVWVGNDNPNQYMSKGADGIYTAAPIWHDFMTQYYASGPGKGTPAQNFVQPPGLQTITVDKLSGKLPTDQSPADQHLTDIFASWQVPKDPDNVHVKLNIDQATGKLATDLTPAADVVQQTFFTVHSERPDNPNWEGPVHDWLMKNGGGVAPPTANDDLHIEDNRPTVNFITPVDGASITGPFSMQVNPGGSEPITQVDFSIDGGSPVATVTSAPWQTTYDPSPLTAGTHVLDAKVTNNIGLTKDVQITITVVSSGAPPVVNTTVSNVVITDGVKAVNKPITITWLNPATSDLSAVNIYQSTTNDPTDLGNKIASVPTTTASSPGTYNVSVSSFQAGQTYYYILRAVNAAGVEGPSSSKYAGHVQ